MMYVVKSELRTTIFIRVQDGSFPHTEKTILVAAAAGMAGYRDPFFRQFCVWVHLSYL